MKVPSCGFDLLCNICTLPDRFCDFCKAPVPAPDSCVRSSRNLVPYRICPYSTKRRIGVTHVFSFPHYYSDDVNRAKFKGAGGDADDFMDDDDDDDEDDDDNDNDSDVATGGLPRVSKGRSYNRRHLLPLRSQVSKPKP